MKAVLLTSVVIAATGACSDEVVTEPEDTSVKESSVTVDNHLGFNRIATNRIATNRIATNRIATNSLGGGNYALDEDSAGTLISTADGRELLDYIITCALTANQTIHASYEGVDYTFTGDIGLARGWVHRRLTGSEQRWVSACLLSRVNAHGISLLVSLRGPNHYLNVTADEVAAYSVEEGAFFGNVFGDPDDPIIAYACTGFDQAQGEPATGAPLGDRDCAEDDGTGQSACEFTVVGNCRDFGAELSKQKNQAPHACEDQASDARGGHYKQCHDELSDNRGRFPRHSEWREVITVFVQP